MIESICRRLDGLPLAIELAAARTRSMTPVELLEGLDDRFRVLRLRAGGAQPRHVTLHDTIEWSYRLLSQDARSVLDQLSVFAGTFDADAGRMVCRAPSGDDLEVRDLLDDLVDRSLVVAERSGRQTRFRLLETIREFAGEQLRSSGDDESTRNRHLAHYTAVSAAADDLLRTREQETAVAIFDLEWDNLRRALDWAITTRDQRSAERIVLSTRLLATDRLRWEHSDWCRRCIALDPASSAVEVLAQAAVWAHTAEEAERKAEYTWLAQQALDPMDPRSATFLVFMEPGEDPRFPDPQAAVEALLPAIDLDREWWLARQLADTALNDAPEVPTAIQRLVIWPHECALHG